MPRQHNAEIDYESRSRSGGSWLEALPWYVLGGVTAAVAIAGLAAAGSALVTVIRTGQPFTFACVLMGLVLAAGCGFVSFQCFRHAVDEHRHAGPTQAENDAFLRRLRGDGQP